jgi:tRNA-splicing ligase RtcB (3'-phosphate/5'-hydroxy nucleic acid ligase)
MNSERSYDVIECPKGVPIKAWTRGVSVEPEAVEQLRKLASLPFIFKWVAVMPDVHKGMGATIGSVIPTKGAVIPAAVGVDIGCGMVAAQTSLTASELPKELGELRRAIERAVPHGRTNNGQPGDRGAWGRPPEAVRRAWRELEPRFEAIKDAHPRLGRGPTIEHLGTLGTGNHFIELCLDGEERVWIMLHSGSRGVGNRIGRHFINLAKESMRRWFIDLPDADLAYFPEGADGFRAYLDAAQWAQDYAAANRELMLEAVVEALREIGRLPAFEAPLDIVRCHHNYVSWEKHYGQTVLVTRKGAVRAQVGDRGIIPGSMGARSYLVRGLGQQESFTSCSHGAGRAMSRTAARKSFTVEQHMAATAGIECRKDADVLDETPAAYKPIEAVMAAQRDLVEVTHELRQVLCVKG